MSKMNAEEAKRKVKQKAWYASDRWGRRRLVVSQADVLAIIDELNTILESQDEKIT